MHRTAFEFGGLVIHWYGVLVACGFLAGIMTAIRRARGARVHADTVIDVVIWIAVGSLIGARTLFVVTYWDQFRGASWIDVINIRNGGLVFYGGFIGAVIAGGIYTWRKNLGFWKMADLLAPSVPLGQVAGRAGCFLNGCCYGHPTAVSWAITYKEPHERAGIPVHPTQVYEAVLCLGLFFFLEWHYRRGRRFEGATFASYLLGYAVLRSVVEVFRGDYPTGVFVGSLSPGQSISVLIFAAGLGVWAWRRSARLPGPPGDAEKSK